MARLHCPKNEPFSKSFSGMVAGNRFRDFSTVGHYHWCLCLPLSCPQRPRVMAVAVGDGDLPLGTRHCELHPTGSLAPRLMMCPFSWDRSLDPGEKLRQLGCHSNHTETSRLEPPSIRGEPTLARCRCTKIFLQKSIFFLQRMESSLPFG